MELSLNDRHEALVRVWERRRNECVKDLLACSNRSNEYVIDAMASAQTAGTMIRHAAESALANVARDFVPTWERMLSIGAKLERLGELWHQPQGVREAEIEAMEAELKPVKIGGVK
jgi:hypothetical protein